MALTDSFDPSTPTGAQSHDILGIDPFGMFDTGNSDPTGGKMTAGQGAVYGNLYGQSQGQGSAFNGMAGNYSQGAPQIGQTGQLSSISDYYQNAMNGKGPTVAQNQLTAGTDQAIAAQEAMANSTRGGAAARVGAERAGQLAAGTTMAGEANSAAQLRAQEMNAAAQGMTQAAGMSQAQATNNAQLQQTNQAQINQMKLGLYGMGEQEQQMSLADQQAYMNNLLAAEGMNAQQSQFNTQMGVQVGSAAVSALGSAAGAAASDETLKTGITPQGISSINYGEDPVTEAPPNPTAPASLASSTAQPKAPDTGAKVGSALLQAGTGATEGAAAGGPWGAIIGGVGGLFKGLIASDEKLKYRPRGLANVY